MSDDLQSVLTWLRSPEAIRQRCEMLYGAVLAGESPHFTVHEEQLAMAVDYVLAELQANYPDLAVPYHSRWRHFAAGGRERWAELAASLDSDPLERGRSAIELVIVSVLLDAGAGPDWRYHDPLCPQALVRSEGLAAASFDWYRHGGLSGLPEQPWRVDASALQQLDPAALQDAFQVGPDNPLLGVDGRVQLLHRLGAAVAAQPEIFSAPSRLDTHPSSRPSSRPSARLGSLFDYLLQLAGPQQQLAATRLLSVILTTLSSIWPGRIELAGENLGDVWRHPMARSTEPEHDPSTGLVPFHKLSQWLTYSLVEPLEEAGVTVSGLDQLTGLPEYRNGGLFIDLGVLKLKNPAARYNAHPVDSELVVEWRALTVVLLDRLAAGIRTRLGLDQEQLPLAKVLQGGSWSAGRRIARELRPDGAPPLQIISDGTVF